MRDKITIAKNISPEAVEVLFSSDFGGMKKLLQSLPKKEVAFVDADEHDMRSWHAVARQSGMKIRTWACKRVAARVIVVV